MKFKKKPLVVEAEQYWPDKKIDGLERVPSNFMNRDRTITSDFISDIAYICTPEGKMKVNPGDWVITGIEGEKYCCKQSIFEKTYEKVEE